MKLITADRGVVSVELPACPACGELPQSDMVTVRCGCGRTETPVQYLLRVCLMERVGVGLSQGESESESVVRKENK